MKTELILTFEKGEQKLVVLEDFIPFNSKERMIGFCLGLCGDWGKSDCDCGNLVKVSMCITGEYGEENKIPDWYKDCNGELWEGELG